MDENDRILAEAVRRGKRRTAWFMGGFAVLLLAPAVWLVTTAFRAEDPLHPRLSDSERGELARLADQLDAARTACEASWTALDPAAANVVEGEAPCGAELPAPSPSAAAIYLETGGIQPGLGEWAIHKVKPGEWPDRLEACRALAKRAEEARRGLQDGSADRYTLKALRSQLVASPEVILITEEDVAAVPTEVRAAPEFAPGRVTGRALVYSPAEGRFVCAGRVAATSSESIDFTVHYRPSNPTDEHLKTGTALRYTAERDLELRLREAIAGGMHAASPVVTPAP